jgi:signal transduction histidine kinase
MSHTLRVVAAVALAMLILALLIYKTRAVDLEAHNAIVDTLRQIDKVDSKLNNLALQAKLAQSSDYDAIAAIFPTLRTLHGALETGPLGLRGRHSARVDHALDAYLDLMSTKEELTERFKSHNAVVRNSMNFLPVGGDQLVSELGVQGRDGLSRAVEGLVKDVLEYDLLGTVAAQAQVQRDIQGLRARSADLDTAQAVSLAQLLAHAKTILREKPITDRLLNDLVHLPSAKYRNDLGLAYERVFNTRQEEVNVYRVILMGYSMLLLLAIVYLGYRQQHGNRILNAANTRFAKANQSLKLRTAQLHKALSSLKDSQAHLIQAEKMSSLGQMVAGVTHEINTPLGYVTSNVSILRERLPIISQLMARYRRLFERLSAPEGDEQAIARELEEVAAVAESEGVEEICQEAEELLENSAVGLKQISTIVVNLKDFSRLDRDCLEPFDVNKGLDGTLVIARNLIKNKVEVIKRYSDVPHIRCSPSQINQVFLNLIANAAQAMETRGRLILETRRVDDAVEVTVLDNGKGIPKRIVRKIFDPFFTTKPVGQGTGLGLSIVYRIIKQHQGKIRITSMEGKGTRITVRLPIRHQGHQPASDHELQISPGDAVAASGG